ncbi:MAG: mannose-1-phosphate guanylyltransferase/mannose-6-phosphate isomerase [Desulfobulbaceae bacterium]|nr:mannose-1-phosphate guanylyltransferase/mannose-6-phosphate isomerase [Desulfobulbaceae bacterium]MDY0350033.1 mannose-1-phosphate guanylyltransferase/mannose-6-phosphate isomerase [Desulfobulbaceae bacterium]
MRIQPVILAGGTGSRLWPLSRELYPKQLIKLLGSRSLLQTTLERVKALPGAAPPVVVVGEEHRFLTKTQIEELNTFPEYHLLLEPVGRNTAAAICGAALFVRQYLDNGSVLLVLPADHLITAVDAFVAAVREACLLAEAGNVTTFGIVPTSPETGYGYIARGEGNRVLSFVEKPDLQTAREYVAGGRHLWNSGMFAFTVETLLAELSRYEPVLIEQMTRAVADGKWDGVFFRLDREAMEPCTDDSIDYALMEKTERAAVVEADIGWSDVGSWRALWELADKDDRGNVLSGDVILEDVENSLIRAGDSLVAAIGLRDTMVVETADAVLVAPIARSQDVKKIVEQLKLRGRNEFLIHRTVHRPWGSYTTLESGERFQIKRITVNPGARLSLQMHHHRHEHWVVVRGMAKVTNGEKVILLDENKSTYITAGEKHRLENPGTIPLELIEVQIGSYLGEDDIVRYDDEYGREQE